MRVLGLVMLIVAALVPFSARAIDLDACLKQCEPLRENVKPESEGKRVYRNCRNGCVGQGNITCGDGSLVPAGTACPKAQAVGPAPKPVKPKKQAKFQTVCVWNGTAPFCSGRCSGKGVWEAGRSEHGGGESCVTGSKAYCCQKVRID